jgi:ribosomal protein S18 acetylase RimI-like enzyme
VTTTLVDLGLPAVVLLEVAADNLPAQALYDALGFVVIHRRRNYYLRQIGETVVAVDALLMRWTAAGDGEQRGED